MTKKLTLRSLYSGVVVAFCLTFICFLPVTVPLLAKLGAPILLTTQDVTLTLRLFLVMSAVGFIWSYRLQSNLRYVCTGLISLVLIFIGHEVMVSATLFYLGIAGLITSSLLKVHHPDDN